MNIPPELSDIFRTDPVINRVILQSSAKKLTEREMLIACIQRLHEAARYWRMELESHLARFCPAAHQQPDNE